MERKLSILEISFNLEFLSNDKSINVMYKGVYVKYVNGNYL